MFQKRRGYLVACIVLVLSAGLVSIPPQVKAGWARADASYVQDERVCRDGMIVSALTTDTNEPLTGKQTPISVRYYDTTTFPPLDASEVDGQRPELYGPLIVPSRMIQLPYHPDEPYSVDLDGDGFDDYDATLYARNITLLWPRLLDVGKRIVIRGGTLATFTASVTNCLLNRMTTFRGGRATIDGQRLMAADSSVPPADLFYRVDTLPTHGTLLLNGAPLAVGSFFSQADINANRLSYDHNGDASASDSFRFTTKGTFRVSVATGGGQGTGGASREGVISGDGEHVAFTSGAINLVPGDTNKLDDVFRHDLVTRQTQRLSVSQAGAQANAGSALPAISLDGKAVSFQTTASNLVNNELDEFEILQCGKVKDTNGLMDIYVSYRGDLNNPHPPYRASVATRDFGDECFDATGGPSLNSSISSDGEYISFESDADNLIESDTNEVRDIFGYFQDNIERLSVAGEAGDDIEVFGRSYAATIGLPTEAPDRIVRPNTFVSSAVDLVANDTNNLADVFVRNFFFSSDVVRVSVSTSGAQATGGASGAPSVSAGGRFVAFESDAKNLVTGDTLNFTDIFVRDRDTDSNGEYDEPGSVSTTRVSIRTGGTQANGASHGPAISADGRYIAFESAATNLVNEDTNNIPDIFVHDLVTKQTTRVSVSGRGGQMNGPAGCNCRLSTSGDGSLITFTSSATNLVGGDSNGQPDVFVHYRGYSSQFTIGITKPTDTAYLPGVLR